VVLGELLLSARYRMQLLLFHTHLRFLWHRWCCCTVCWLRFCD